MILNVRLMMDRAASRLGASAVMLFLAIAAVLPLHARQLPPAPRLPSIVFIMADDLGYGDLGCYGQSLIKTPNLDKLASEGMVFTSCYAGSTVCAPSRASLLTGKHTGHVRIRGNKNLSLSSSDYIISEMLSAAGYYTAAVGKWGVGDAGSPATPIKKGFDDWLGFLNQTHAHQYYPYYLNRSDRKGHDEMMEFPDNASGRKGTYAPDLFIQFATNVARIHHPDQFNHYRPFFLYMAYTTPHANNELGRETGNGMEVPSDYPYSNEPWPQVEKNKAAMITRMDTDIGVLLGDLEHYGIAKNTIVIFTSDNGPHKEGGVTPGFFRSSGPLRGIKRDLYEGGIRVPLIVRWPFMIPKGVTNDFPCAFWDFLPTFADIVHATPPGDIDGISILPTLSGHTQTNRHEFFYWEFHEKAFSQAVRMGDWKAIRTGTDGPMELYNLKADIAEKHNVADEHPEVVAKITEYLKTARTEDPNWPAKTVAENQMSEKPGKESDKDQ